MRVVTESPIMVENVRNVTSNDMLFVTAYWIRMLGKSLQTACNNGLT